MAPLVGVGFEFGVECPIIIITDFKLDSITQILKLNKFEFCFDICIFIENSPKRGTKYVVKYSSGRNNFHKNVTIYRVTSQVDRD